MRMHDAVQGRFGFDADGLDHAQAKLAAWGAGVFHGTVMVGRKQKADANVTNTAFGLGYGEVKRNTGLFKKVRAT